MFTKNFKLMQQAFFTSAYVSGFKDVNGESKTIDPTGTYFSKYVRMPGYLLTQAHMHSDELGVLFGTDPTPATLNDYKMGARITSGISVANPSKFIRTEDTDKGTVTYSATYSVTNTSEAEINIYEIGVFCPATNGSNSTTFGLMMEHTVLTEPIKITPGEIKAITYKLTFRNALIFE